MQALGKIGLRFIGRGGEASRKLAARALAGVAALALGASAMGQRATDERAVTLESVATMHVSPGGVGAFSSRGCPQTVSSKTGASFTGGTYAAQAGFAQGESAGVTYQVPSNQFPIRIDLSEMIFATSGATQATVTEWAIEFWEGVPSPGGQGRLVLRAESNDEDLPHIRLGAGTNGVNVNFSVDPGDPEQIIIDRFAIPGTIPQQYRDEFTVVWQIVRHNQASASPCFSSSPSCCNAYPVTDNTQIVNYSQLDFPDDNWLFGLNCGILGCPPNGGWARFAGLSMGVCRPRGDWVTRTTWTSVLCTPGSGACCLPNGSCEFLTSAQCASQSGVYRGDNVACSGANCPQPTGACCAATGFCAPLTQGDCGGIPGAVWQGAGTSCGANNTCPTGACCLASGQCVVATSTSCASQGGTFRGVGVACAGANCPPPTGACCFASGTCVVQSELACTGFGGSFAGAGTTCTDANSNGSADACEAPACNDVDFNNDSVFPDLQDVTDFFGVFGGESCASCDDIDFNSDGVFPDLQDLTKFVEVFAGAPC
jgi:hypothetical protein